jgi:hypothetical protein
MISLVTPTPRYIRLLKKKKHDIMPAINRSRIIERQGEMVGFVVYDPFTLAPDILHIFVEHRCQGIGTATMAILSANSRSSAMDILAVPAAIGFWLKMGFVPHKAYDVAQLGCVPMTYCKKPCITLVPSSSPAPIFILTDI